MTIEDFFYVQLNGFDISYNIAVPKKREVQLSTGSLIIKSTPLLMKACSINCVQNQYKIL